MSDWGAGCRLSLIVPGLGDTWPLIARLIFKDPATHAYLLYDVMYELGRTELRLVVERGYVTGYVLRWTSSVCSVVAWGTVPQGLVEELVQGCRGPVVMQLRGAAADLAEGLAGRLGCRAARYVDMVASEDRLRPRGAPPGARVVRLSPLNPEHVEAYRVFEEARRERTVSREEALGLVRELRPHGVFVDGRLVAAAGSYVRTRLVWILGNVYTLPEHRRRGYGGAAVSSVALDAVSMGAVAALHVEEGNAAARGLYKSLGFGEKRMWPWLFC